MAEFWYCIEQRVSDGTWHRLTEWVDDPAKAQAEGDRLSASNPMIPFRLVARRIELDVTKSWGPSRG